MQQYIELTNLLKYSLVERNRNFFFSSFDLKNNHYFTP